MPVIPTLPSATVNDINVEPDIMPNVLPPERAMDGFAAERPGDPAPAPAADNEPIFSTDPLK